MSSQIPQPPPDIPAHLHHDLGRAGSFKKPEMPTSACMSCNRRKLKCDREANGCSNCVKSDVTCIYPPQKRAARRKRGPYNKEKTRRERELEASLKSLGLKSLELTTDSFGAPNFIPGTLDSIPNSGALSNSYGSDPAGAIQQWAQAIHGLGSHSATPNRSPEQRHINHAGQQWPVMPVVTDAMAMAQNGPYGLTGPYSPEQGQSSLLDNQSDLIFGSPTSTTSSLYAYHPPSSQVLEYWQIFTVNIDPVTKILHVPSFSSHIMEAKLDLQTLDVGLEALMFAVYFAAVTSLSPSECQIRFGEGKETLLTRYRGAVEKALGKSNLLTSQNMMTLQALTLYLSCLRVSDTSRMTYTLTGLAMRLAKSMDLHLENPRLHVSPFENEMRKRLWWSICSLECRSAEEYGFHPTNGGQTYDCSLPLNVNDEDLDPEATEPPEPRSGSTNMTWALVRFELARIIFQVWNLSSKPDKRNSSFDARTMETEKERILDEGNSLLETQYLKHCRSSRAFDWMTATFTRLMITKLRLILHHPFNPDAVHPLPRDLREKCFQTSIEIIEQASLLRNEPRIRRWTWVFQNHHQWQALSYILSELCHRTGSEQVDRAWRIVDETVTNWDESVDRIRQSVMWEPMNRLLSKARQVRQQDLVSRQNSYSSSNSDQTHISPNFETWMNPNTAFHPTEPLTIPPSAVTATGGSTMAGFVDPEPWFSSSVSSTDIMLPNMPAMCPDPLDSGFSTPLVGSTAGPTRTNSDLQSLVEGLETFRPDELAALFENYPMTY